MTVEIKKSGQYRTLCNYNFWVIETLVDDVWKPIAMKRSPGWFRRASISDPKGLISDPCGYSRRQEKGPSA